MLELVNLSVAINSDRSLFEPVQGINLTVESGEVQAIIGESGSGKTLTALSIMRLLPTYAKYSAGSQIFLHGRDLCNLSEKQMRKVRGSDVAMIFQDPMTSLNPVLTVGNQISEVISMHRGIRGRACYVEVLQLLDAVRIPDAVQRYNSYPHELSGGMKQRIMIAMALAGHPSLLIADEPTTALDVTTQAQILQLLRELQQQHKMAMLLITHDIAVAAQMADKIAVMRKGQVIEQDYSERFFNAPRHEYSRQLLDSVPDMFSLAQAKSLLEPSTLLDVKDLKVYFPIKSGIWRKTVGQIKAVDGVNFSLAAGETLALVGESGCGKTTVAKSILSLVDTAQGQIEFGGQNLLALSTKEWRRKRVDLQIVFQDPFSALDPKMRILEILSEGLQIQKGKKISEQQLLIDTVLNQVGLSPEYLNRYPHELSGGERQRICIARALVLQPKILICDEPTSSLDVSVQAQVLRLLQTIQRELNLALLFISHDLAVVSNLADRVAIMYLGRVIETGLTSEVLNSPKHPYTQVLLAAVPKIGTRLPIQTIVKGDLPSPASPPKGCHFHPRCKFAKPACRVEYPAERNITATHAVNCILY